MVKQSKKAEDELSRQWYRIMRELGWTEDLIEGLDELVEDYYNGTRQKWWQIEGGHETGKNYYGNPDEDGDMVNGFMYIMCPQSHDPTVKVQVRVGTNREEMVRVLKKLTKIAEEEYEEDM